MLAIFNYNRQHALEYAVRWAFDRNPRFYDFKGIGGDCTNFVSQCIYAGCCQMNYTPDVGWYYNSVNDRAAAWTGVEYFYNFITTNNGEGPFGHVVRINDLQIGDVIQLGNEEGRFYHTLLVTDMTRLSYFVSAHEDDALDRNLNTYMYSDMRCIHIDGYRADENHVQDCFYRLML